MSSFSISHITEKLEYLEIDFSAMDGFGRAASGGWAAGDVGGAFGTTTVTSETFLGGMGSVTSTTTTVESVDDEGDRNRVKCGLVVAGVVYPVLKGLKITLPENAFALVSSWDMPNLQTLTVALTPAASPASTSSSSSTSPSPFHRFFQTHGKKLVQLELSSPITPAQSSNSHHKDDDEEEELSLSKLCPNLKSFICNCGTGGEEVEWDWENPYWVAPHPLLTSHENLEFIGNRGLGEVASPPPTSPTYPTYLYNPDPSPFFMLLEQLTCLLRKPTGGGGFPSLKFIRDMSEDSDVEVEEVDRETKFPINTGANADADDGGTGPCEDRLVLAAGVGEDGREWGICGGLEGG
ncbi:hypothetical protein AAF712_012969 [Marasmius tenuissimus]|uniref:Uncharacterized protein n=1 Tax=Marasmius tenuissimus TaxID=585030 RepID=A0ABR2ZGF7_9AGAR